MLRREGKAKCNYVSYDGVCVCWICQVYADVKRVLEAIEGNGRQECFLFDEESVLVNVREGLWQQIDCIYSIITSYKHK